jgi:hypothetical protein
MCISSHISSGPCISTFTLFEVINFLSTFRLRGISSFPRNNLERFLWSKDCVKNLSFLLYASGLLVRIGKSSREINSLPLLPHDLDRLMLSCLTLCEVSTSYLAWLAAPSALVLLWPYGYQWKKHVSPFADNSKLFVGFHRWKLHDAIDIEVSTTRRVFLDCWKFDDTEAWKSKTSGCAGHSECRA